MGKRTIESVTQNNDFAYLPLQFLLCVPTISDISEVTFLLMRNSSERLVQTGELARSVMISKLERNGIALLSRM